MPTYKVIQYYRYKDVQEIEAASEEEAVKIAEGQADEQYDAYLDYEVVEVSNG
jgi:hypothetical protein